MEPGELKEAEERAEVQGEKRIGVTMAVVAVFLALATMLAHRKNSRSHMYEADSRLAKLSSEGKDIANQLAENGKKESEDAEKIRQKAEHFEEQTDAAARRATYFDVAEVMLEISLVLCSVTLLTTLPVFWLSSFISTLSGLGLIVFAALR
ncbi:MAG: hypothetical protein DMG61_05995 [Acidobacteria bacterium]|nr:MAG: hypothetical protein DMG61_05995 [Acidobacteriota bacterium]